MQCKIASNNLTLDGLPVCVVSFLMKASSSRRRAPWEEAAAIHGGVDEVGEILPALGGKVNGMGSGTLNDGQHGHRKSNPGRRSPVAGRRSSAADPLTSGSERAPVFQVDFILYYTVFISL
uniref:Uncharacterized protein n=1 Tax=Oryza punctata TaxID=4537 RepID=A0A0E0JEJ7_ORYPU